MSFDNGDVLHVDAPIVDHKKYHICLGTNEFTVTLCLFLNSEGGFEGDMTFDCQRFPMLPPSKTGKSVVSLSMLPRYNEKQLELFKAHKIGELAKDVALELAEHCKTVRTLPRGEKAFVIERLTAYATT